MESMKSEKDQPIDSFPRLEEFLGYIQAILERSEGTVRQYRYDLVLFFRFLLAGNRALQPEDEAWEQIDISTVNDSFLRSACGCQENCTIDPGAPDLIPSHFLRLPDIQSPGSFGECGCQPGVAQTG